LWHEAATARSDDDHRRDEHAARVGIDAPLALGSARERGDHLAEMEDGLEWLDLLEQPVSQLLSGADWNAGDVIDGLFGIELGALPARLVENNEDTRFQPRNPNQKQGK